MLAIKPVLSVASLRRHPIKDCSHRSRFEPRPPIQNSMARSLRSCPDWPHNLARHTLAIMSSGAFKADHVATRLSSLRAGISCKAIVADFLESHDTELTEALGTADVI